MRYSIDRKIYIKEYRLLPFAKKMSKNLSNEYSTKKSAKRRISW